MAYRYEVEVTVSFARDLKNVNWRYGPTRPYAVLWIDPNNKCTTRADDSGDTCPRWDQTLVIPVPPLPIEDATLYIDVVHAGSEEGTKRLIGSARLRLQDVIDEVGFRERSNRTLQLKRPSGRPQGKIELEISVKEPGYRAPDPYAAPPYGVPPPQSRDVYGRAPPYGVPPPTRDFYGGAQPYGYPYGAPPNPYYSGEAASGYQYGEEKKKKSGMGMGTGLAIGAVGGALGAVALMEGADWVEDKIDDKVDDAVEEALEDDAGDDDY